MKSHIEEKHEELWRRQISVQDLILIVCLLQPNPGAEVFAFDFKREKRQERRKGWIIQAMVQEMHQLLLLQSKEDYTQ